MTQFPWPRGAATGIGSLPGTDIDEAQRTVLGELPDLPHLPELPDRGAGADMIGRGAGLLVDLPVELYAGAWRVAARPGRDARRTADLLERDLDTLTEQADGYTGPLKIQAVGPWTLASSVDLLIGGRILRDPGAVRDLTASLAEGLARHVLDVSRRVPGASVLLQLDEPMLPTVLAGHVPTESGFSVLRAVESGTAVDALRTVITRAGVSVVVHCCAPDVPVALLRSAGAAAVALDLALLRDLDPLGEALDAGMGLFAGAAPTSLTSGSGAPRSLTSTSGAPTSPESGSGAPRSPESGSGAPRSPESGSGAAVADRVQGLWQRLGFPADRLSDQVVVTPACGLAGASVGSARRILAACREAGRRLAES